jgi:HAD superfamily hydrolase (TIGR01509 family)
LIKNIFWDNDGVLVDTEKYYFQATIETIASVGIKISKEEFIEYSLKESKGVWHLAVNKGLDPESLSDLKKQRNLLYNKYVRTQDIFFPEVDKTLQLLYNQYRMAIVTTSKKTDFEAIHTRTDYLKYFEKWLTLGDYEKSKPAPDPYWAAIEKMKVNPMETIVVEDTQRGLISANAAGLRCIVIPTELSKYQDYSTAFDVLKSIKDLPGILKELN